MESQEAKLYRGDRLVHQLYLLGDNDDIDEITIGKDGNMVVSTIETVQKDEGDRAEFISEEREHTGITRISFK